MGWQERLPANQARHTGSELSLRPPPAATPSPCQPGRRASFSTARQSTCRGSGGPFRGQIGRGETVSLNGLCWFEGGGCCCSAAAAQRSRPSPASPAPHPPGSRTPPPPVDLEAGHRSRASSWLSSRLAQPPCAPTVLFTANLWQGAARWRRVRGWGLKKGFEAHLPKHSDVISSTIPSPPRSDTCRQVRAMFGGP